MAKSLEKIKSGLKLRTQPREGALTLRLGTRKYTLPFETRLITSDDYVFIHIPPTAEILKIDGKEIVVVTSSDEADNAASSFRKRRSRAKSTRQSSLSMPSDIQEMLNKLGAGVKIGYGPDGTPRLVRVRKRRANKG